MFRGDRACGEFIAFWLRDGRVAAGMNASIWDMNEHIEALSARARPAGAAALADHGAPQDWLASLRLEAERRNDHGAQSQSATTS